MQATKRISRDSVKQALVQILVVVARTQVKPLRTVEGKGSVRAAIGHG